MIKINDVQGNKDVFSTRLKINHLLTEVLKRNVLVAASEPTFFELKDGLDTKLLTVWIRLSSQSIGFSFFQQQLTDAIALWDRASAAELKASLENDLTGPGKAIEFFWANPPKERIFLVFNGIEHIQSGPRL